MQTFESAAKNSLTAANSDETDNNKPLRRRWPPEQTKTNGNQTKQHPEEQEQSNHQRTDKTSQCENDMPEVTNGTANLPIKHLPSSQFSQDHSHCKITNGFNKTQYDDDSVDFVLAYNRRRDSTNNLKKFDDEAERQKFYHQLQIYGILIKIDEDPTNSLDAGRTCYALLRLSKRLLNHNWCWSCKCQSDTISTDSDDKNERQNNNVDITLTSAQRAQIVWRFILQINSCTNKKSKDNVMSLDQLLEAGIITAAYPVHDGDIKSDNNGRTNDRQILYEQWARPGLILSQNWKGDFRINTLIRKYYGTPVAVYFRWLRFYTVWLVGPAIAGLVWFLYGLLTTQNDPPTRDICNQHSEVADWILCPTRKCDSNYCGFSRVLDTCGLYRWTSAATFDRPGAVVFTIFMSFWATVFQQLWTVYGCHFNKNDSDTLSCMKCIPQSSQLLSKSKDGNLPTQFQKSNSFVRSNTDFNAKSDPGSPVHTKPIIFTRLTRLYTNSLPMLVRAAVFAWTLILAAAIPILIVVYRGRAIGFLMSVVFRQDEEKLYRPEQRHHSFFLLNYTSSGELNNWRTVVATLCAAFVQLAAIVAVHRAYSAVAEWLTKFSYHSVYDSRFQSLYTAFMSCFDSANYYSSLVYIAFFKGRFATNRNRHSETTVTFSSFWPITILQKLIHHVREDVCDPAAAGTGCVPELCIQLAIIMIGKQIIDNIIELSMPLSLNLWRRWRANMNRRKVLKKKLSNATTSNIVSPKQWQLDYHLEDSGPLGLYQEYSEMVIQYGFVVMFTTSFPLAPLCALLNNILEQRLDAYKMIVAQRRPVPAYYCTGSGKHRNGDSCCDNCVKLGAWTVVLKILSDIAVVYNVFVIAFTSDLIPRTVYANNFSEQSSLEGYVAWTLSKERNMTEYYYDGKSYDNRPDMCRYRGYHRTESSQSSSSYIYWHILAAQLIFVILFEHIILIINAALKYIVHKYFLKDKTSSEKETEKLSPINNDFVVKSSQSTTLVSSTNITNDKGHNGHSDDDDSVVIKNMSLPVDISRKRLDYSKTSTKRSRSSVVMVDIENDDQVECEANP
ncbi:anoctamin-7-like [Daktulosphaira vitifoliae]|uniref:anoctamin-7-like n=1 Tax=Daktulosphaira vitifoliae TaxID=58002 RepID=UPI0021A97912|nr:anoctamin-7-like [Daktulosphaira vitifoliae]